MSNYAGSEWIRAAMQRQGRTVSPFGAKIADLLGDLYLGIYHVQQEVLHKRVRWEETHHVEIVVRDSRFATFDSEALTRLVVLCHEYCVRCEVQAASRGYLRLWFSPRHGREGDVYARHPTIEQAVERVRASSRPQEEAVPA